MKKSISIIILTYNAENYIERQLSMIDNNRYNVLIVDSSSKDKTISICKKMDFEYIIINQKDFNHGLTREKYRKYFDDTFTVFLTQDAIPLNESSIDKLVAPLMEGLASCSYGRQKPVVSAGILESFPREFNYPRISNLRSISDLDRYGVYTFFCSNSFAAYNNHDLDTIGGFKYTLTNEDYFACAELLLDNNKVAYIADSIVIHSHKLTLVQEFQRYFDTGYVRAVRKDINKIVGHADKRGFEFLKGLIKKLFYENPLLIPYAIAQTIFKYIGFKIGYYGLKLPVVIKKKLSNEKYFWKEENLL